MYIQLYGVKVPAVYYLGGNQQALNQETVQHPPGLLPRLLGLTPLDPLLRTGFLQQQSTPVAAVVRVATIAAAAVVTMATTEAAAAVVTTATTGAGAAAMVTMATTGAAYLLCSTTV